MTFSIPISDPDQDQQITDVQIATFINFLFRSSDKRGHPLQLPRRSIEDNEPDSEANISHAPLPGATGFRRSRTVLDALVGICVSNGHQCLALSVTFGTTFVLATFAENNRKPPATIESHLQNIWIQLRALSRLQQRVRKAGSFLDIRGDSGTSPKAAETLLRHDDGARQDLQVIKDTLYHDIHKYCYLKTRQRYKKYLGGYPAFYEFYINDWRVLDPDRRLRYSMVYVLQINNFLEQNVQALDSTDWSEIARQCSLLYAVYTPNEENLEPRIRTVMAVWAKHPRVQEDKKTRTFDLQRAITKIITLTAQINHLVNFAYSPRLRSTLEKQLEIIRLEPLSTTLPNPSQTAMNNLVRQAFSATAFAAQEPEQDFKKQVPDILNDQLAEIPSVLEVSTPVVCVHAEYRLLIHHHQHPSKPPPFRYIAVNKLSCFACWSVFNAYTHATRRIFSLRGSHSKLYYPWWPAGCEFSDDVSQKLRNELWKKLVGLYSVHLVELQETSRRRRSDSSVATELSEEAGGSLVSGEDLERAKEKADQDFEKAEEVRRMRV